MENFKYQEELNLCLGRIKEGLPNADINKLDDIIIEIRSGDLPISFDKENATLYIDSQKLDIKEDRANEIMKGLLEIISTDFDTKDSGISMNGKMDAINKGINNQLANALIPTKDENLKDFECNVITNLFTHIAGTDLVFDSYFRSSGEEVYKSLLNNLGGDTTFLDTMLTLSNIEVTSIDEKQYPSMLGYIESSVSKKYIDSNNLTIEAMENFSNNILFTEPRFAPEDGRLRLNNCANADFYVKERIDVKRQEGREQVLEDMMNGYFDIKKGETYDSGRTGHK